MLIATSDQVELTLPRVSRPRLRRVVVIGLGGWVSLGAFEWIHGVGAEYLHLTRTGQPLATSTRFGLNQPALRRAQALARDTPTGLDIARDLITEKIAGQLEVLNRRGLTQNIEDVQGARDAVTTARTITDLRLAEAQAAHAYWQALAPLTVRFARPDQARVPAHWKTIGHRASALTGGPRRATTPAHSLWNACYGLAQVETRVACVGAGLDPGIAIIHADQPGRDSMVLDLIEPVRPVADGYLIDVLERTVFTQRSFRELPNGEVRVSAPVMRELTATLPLWTQTVAPHAEHVASMLAHQAGLGDIPTKLTQRKRRAGRDAHGSHSRQKPIRPARLTSACQDCGLPLAGAGRKRCPDCHANANRQRMVAYQAEEGTRRKLTSDHPTTRPDVRERIATRQRDHWQARSDTGETSGYTGHPSQFRRLILPKLANTRPSDLARATGLSPGYCAQIRDGTRTPHPRHWAAFQLVAHR